jgi:hypothetical protein
VLIAYQAHTSRNKVTVSYALTANAALTLTITPPHGRPIQLAQAAAHAGIGTLAWNQRLHGHRATHGRYKLTLTASTSGQPSATSTITITI